MPLAGVWGQISVATITDETTPSSKAVMFTLRFKIGSHPKQFKLVDPLARDIYEFTQFRPMPRAGGPGPKSKSGVRGVWGPRQGSTVTCSSVDVPYITPRAASKALRL